MDINPGDIFMVVVSPQQVIGHEQHSKRPWVVVSRLRVNRQSNLVVGVPLTTTGADRDQHPPYRILIPGSEMQVEPGFTGSLVDSLALVDQVRALDKRRLGAKAGRLSLTAVASLGLGLAYIFDLR